MPSYTDRADDDGGEHLQQVTGEHTAHHDPDDGCCAGRRTRDPRHALGANSDHDVEGEIPGHTTHRLPTPVVCILMYIRFPMV